MKITKVTMTGADDSIRPSELLEISRRYPFVEWGILVSRNSQDSNRFPSKTWMNELAELNEGKLQLACHVCGTYVKEILMGSWRFATELGELWNQFQRVQINTHGQKHQFEFDAITSLKKLNKEIIFQYDGINTAILAFAISEGVNCSTLFDLSHGNGVLPKEWPKPIDNVRCGYAGGLGPENIVKQIKLIESRVGDYELWIDMETQIRSNNDQLFDLSKVVYVLDRCLETGLIITK